jgi:hypothetical protein
MKKKFVLLIFIFISVCLISFIAYSNYIKEKRDTITGESITGEATDATLAVSIRVTIELPIVTIIKPKNHTYITTKNLQLNFTSSNSQTIWYNLDQLGGNITITGNTTFNTTQGQHILYLYSNNTAGNETLDNVTFTVDLNKFRVIYDNYAGTNKGNSTDFNASSYEELQNLSEIILENIEYGKILFDEIINVTDDADVSDNETNLDIYTNISSNHIELNPTALPNFNKLATLSLYNLTFSNPRILRDGSVCPASICAEISYSGNTLIFNVTQFTVYSAGETPIIEEPPPPPGGGAGGKSFSIDVNQISVKLEQGEIETRDIVITNNVNRQLNITISSEKIENFVLIKDSMIILAPGESKSISIDFIARIDEIPDLYPGKIIIKEGRTEKKIPVILEIESKDILLDVYVEIPLTSKRVFPGEDLLAEIMIFNLGAFRGAKEIKIEYNIRDFNGNNIFEEHENITIETQIEFIKKIYIPEDTEYGDYILYIRVIYNGEVASASSQFSIGIISPLILLNLILFSIIGILIIAAFIIFFKIRKIKKHIKYHKIEGHTLLEKGFIRRHKEIPERTSKKIGRYILLKKGFIRRHKEIPERTSKKKGKNK